MSDWWRTFFDPAAGYDVVSRLPPEHTRAQCDFVTTRLKLGRGATLLDLACGTGRHSRIFAEGGLRVVGLDYSQPYLAQAAGDGRGATFVRGDMRDLPLAEASVDGAAMLFNSLGYFRDVGDDLRTLRGVARVLRPGGGLVLDALHRDGAARGFEPVRFEPYNTVGVTEHRRWDATAGRIETTWQYADGRPARATSMRLFTAGELRSLLELAGLVVGSIHGDWHGGPLTLDSPELIVVARRATA